MSGLATSVIPLLSEWEKYAQDHPDGDIPGFAQWFLSRQQPPNPPAPKSPAQDKLPPTTLTGLLITRIYRMLNILSKPKLKELGLAKDIEFGVLAHIVLLRHPNKKQICRELLIENSTGVEITRRLARKGLIIESPDPNDRRSALLTITEKGKKVLIEGGAWFTQLHTAFFNFPGKEENEQLVTLLHQLDQHHTARITDQLLS